MNKIPFASSITHSHILNVLNTLILNQDLNSKISILDAGCGLGHGLAALRAVYPESRFFGIEWSWPLRWMCALRCPWAQVRQGDIWKADWSGYDMVYLFQRPESMERAWRKALDEMAPGSWLVSLEFEATGLRAHARLGLAGSRPVWVYRIGAEGATDRASTARRPGR